MGKIGKYKGSDEEGQRRDDTAVQLKKDASKAINLLKDQYDKLGGADSPVLRESQMAQQQGRLEHEQQSKAMEQKIGQTGLAGSGSASAARENLADAFRNKQAFTQESAIQSQESDLDKITMEIQNIISTTNASLQGLVGQMYEDRTFDPGDLSAYGIE